MNQCIATMQNIQLLPIKTVTLRYDQKEDRIAMAARTEQEEQTLFWLTSRMCRRIVPPLVKSLEKAEEDQQQLIDPDLAMACRQNAAEWQHKEQQPNEVPVELEGNEHTVLLEEIQMKQVPSGLILLFPLAQNKKATLKFTPGELRQWLGILYKQFAAAGWTMEVWPKWFTSRKASGMN